jgi:hypothetical protein
MDKINFNKSILFYNPIFYHFLDGYINPNSEPSIKSKFFLSKFKDELTMTNENIII